MVETDGSFLLEAPTYLFYDTNGIQKHKIAGFPGVEETKRMIEELL